MYKEIITINPQKYEDTIQKLPNYVGVSGKNAGATGISMNKVIIPKGAAAEPHVHVGFETAIYILQGTVETSYGKMLSQKITNTAGEFLFIPAGVPHQPRNMSDTEEAIAIVSRNAPNEQESVRVYDPKTDTIIE